jgi:hypothetical protein
LHQVWNWLDGESKDQLDIFSENLKDPENYPFIPSYVRASAHPHVRFEKLEPHCGVPQTRVTYSNKLDLGGIIPKWAVNRNGVNNLMHISRMRQFFDRSVEIDRGNRARIVDMINNHADEYTEEENEIVDDGLAHLALFTEVKGNVKVAKAISPLSENEISQAKGERLAWGRSRIIVRTSPEDILAYQWDFLALHLFKRDTIEKEVVEEANDHNKVVHMVKVIPKPWNDRELVMRFLWKKLDADTFVFVIQPTSHEKFPEIERRRSSIQAGFGGKQKRVRARFPTVVKLTRAGAEMTKVDYLLQLDIGGDDHGHLVTAIMRIYLVQQLRRTYDLHNFFQELRGLEQWDVDDGKAVGEVMVVKTKAEKHRRKGESKVGARMRELFKKNKGLKEICLKYEFFEVMMARVVQNKLRPTVDVKTKLCNVRQKEGRTMGAGFAISLASHLTAEAAVDEWIGKYSALRELDLAEVWFRPMMIVVARRLWRGIMGTEAQGVHGRRAEHAGSRQ